MDKAKILKNLIEQKYSSVKEFAQYCDLPYTTVYTILKNGVGKATVNNIIAICQKLNITIEQLYNITDDLNSTNSLNILKQTYNLSKLEYAVIKSYLELNEDQRHAFEKFANNIIYNITEPVDCLVHKKNKS